VHARLDKQDEQLASISTKLDYVLDGRLARALCSELSPQLAAMEERLADRLIPTDFKDDSEHSGVSRKPIQINREFSGRGRLQTQSSRAAPRSPDIATGLAPQSAAPVSSVAQARAMLTRTSTLKHSFLRRFVNEELDRHKKDPEKDPVHKIRRLKDRLLESVFGICEADPKEGKEGSRTIHPQSHFATGDHADSALLPAGVSSPRVPRRDAQHELPSPGVLGVCSPDAAVLLG
jgi:hypothetical protein